MPPQLTDAVAAYRRTGADLPWGDPLVPHGVAMEGWFWRLSDPATGRVLVVLCGACHGAAGPWTLVALAASPGGFLRTSICPPATIAPSGRTLRVPDGALEATPDSLRVLLGPDAHLEVELHDQRAWPGARGRRPFGGLGVAHGLPGLGQYWHPHLLGARVTGRATIGDEEWVLDGFDGYAEKNWGGGFPAEWWWGQAQGFDGGETCVAFAGGGVRLGPVPLSPTSLVVRVGDEVVQMALPKAIVDMRADDGRSWSLRARSPRYRVTIAGDANGSAPHHLPVPQPELKSVTNGAAQHFAGRLHLRVERGRRLLFDGVSEVAALERGRAS